MSAFDDILTRLWTANAPQARAIWKEAKERGVGYELRRALAFNAKPATIAYSEPPQ